MGVLNPLYSFLLLLTLPIVALYLLRPRSHKKVVVSTFLWKKALNANDVERLDKRLIKNWLFYLQLAIIIIGALLLMQPFMNQVQVTSDDLVIIIDTSASMSTQIDEATRLDVAKESAVALLKGLSGSPTLSVYSLDDTLTLRYKGHTVSKATQGIVAIQQTEKKDSAQAFEQFVKAYTLTENEGGIYVFTDHPYIVDSKVTYYLSTFGENTIGISSGSYRRGETEDYLQIGLENYSSQAISGELMLYGDDELIQIISVETEEQGGQLVKIATGKFASAYEVKWSGRDDYLLDNSYYIGIQPQKINRVLLAGQSNRFLEEALMILPNTEVYKTESLAIDEDYDLYVYNGVLADELPASGSYLIINPTRSTSYLSIGDVYERGILSFEEGDSIWHHVNTAFNVREVRSIESFIGKTLMSIDDQSVVVKGKIGNHPALVVGFDLLNSDFPVRVGFPVFMHNAASYLVGNLSQDIMAGTVGEPLMIHGNPKALTRYLLTTSGDKIKLDGAYELSVLMDKSGHYVVVENDEKGLVESRLLSMNISKAESENVLVDENGQRDIHRSESLGHYSLKPFIAAFMILLLLIEWWVYYRGY